jgi:hypothetical protein
MAAGVPSTLLIDKSIHEVGGRLNAGWFGIQFGPAQGVGQVQDFGS